MHSIGLSGGRSTLGGTYSSISGAPVAPWVRALTGITAVTPGSLRMTAVHIRENAVFPVPQAPSTAHTTGVAVTCTVPVPSRPTERTTDEQSRPRTHSEQVPDADVEGISRATHAPAPPHRLGAGARGFRTVRHWSVPWVL